jgi:C4-dicarboxylate-specific signal transduction histidine kinase
MRDFFSLDMTDASNNSPHAGATRPLARRYFVALALVAALTVLDQAVVQPLLVRQAFYAPVINVAGRQRMLSQRLTKAALAMQSATSDAEVERRREELATALAQWSHAHAGLLHGDSDMELPDTTSPEILREFAQLQPHFDAMQRAAQALEAKAGTGELETLLRQEQAYLPTMDRIVGLYQREAQRQLARLRVAGFTIMGAVLLLLFAIGLFVVRPATRTIDAQISMLAASQKELRLARDELELRVRKRTEQLQRANQSLQAEMLQREAAEARMRAASDQLAHAARINSLGQLATGLAHELNQPLGAITNYAETADLLLEKSPCERQAAREAVVAVKRAALRAGDIVRRMRNFIRPDRDTRSDVDLPALVREVRDLLYAESLQAGAALHFEIDAELPTVCVDAIQIQQVLVNLMQNALQAMRTTPKVARHLHVALQQHDDAIVVSVRDSGPGFPNENADCCFQPFFTTKPTGLGMGLSISRSIVQQHGGQLWARNLESAGAEVCFSLPANSSPQEAPAHEPDCVCR